MESCQNHFWGALNTYPPQNKSIFFQEQEVSRERKFVASQFGDYKKMFLIVQTYLEGQSLCSPQLTPQIQCLPETGFELSLSKKNSFEGLILAPYFFSSCRKKSPPLFFRYQPPESHWPWCLPLDSFDRACSPLWPKYHSNPKYKVVEHYHDSLSYSYQNKPEQNQI
jgi:hypothetical protein